MVVDLGSFDRIGLKLGALNTYGEGTTPPIDRKQPGNT